MQVYLVRKVRRQLKTGLARLASPAKEGADAMKKLGLSFFDATWKDGRYADHAEEAA